jgi:hypothetical protein
MDRSLRSRLPRIGWWIATAWRALWRRCSGGGIALVTTGSKQWLAGLVAGGQLLLAPGFAGLGRSSAGEG